MFWQISLAIQTISSKRLSFSQFSKFRSRLPSSNKLTMHPDENANGYTVLNLLEIAGSDFKEIAFTGGAFSINVFIECNLDANTCQQKFDVKSLSIGTNTLLPIGNQKVSLYQEKIIPYSDDPDMAEYRVYVGLQFLTNVQVTVKKFSLNRLMILVLVRVIFTILIILDWYWL